MVHTSTPKWGAHIRCMGFVGCMHEGHKLHALGTCPGDGHGMAWHCAPGMGARWAEPIEGHKLHALRSLSKDAEATKCPLGEKTT